MLFSFFGSLIRLGDLLEQGLGLGLGPGLDNYNMGHNNMNIEEGQWITGVHSLSLLLMPIRNKVLLQRSPVNMLGRTKLDF